MEIQKSLVLVRYQLRTAFKYIGRFKSHTVFSLTGLVLGLASIFIISAWSFQELRYDRFHHQSERIYMMTTDIKDNAGNVNRFPETPAPLASELALQIPEIEKAFHFLYLYGGRNIGTGEDSFKEAGIAATPGFFEVFNFRLLTGSAAELDHPNSILLSQTLAEKVFPGTDPVNQELLYKDQQVLVVKGVFKDCPMNSSLQFDFIIPYAIEYGISTEWWQLSDATIVKLTSGSDPDNVRSKIETVWREKITDDQFGIGWISMPELRYGADFEFFNAEHGHGDRRKLFMFMGVAILILILACLNYLNLASSHALKREKEIWIRKVHGASSGVIRSYFIYESVLTALLAWGLAALIAVLGIRLFENLIGIVIAPSYLFYSVGIGLIASILIVGFATGLYPSIKAGAAVLVHTREQWRPGTTFQRNLRRVFVGSQFILSIALTISGLVIFRQAAFMKNFETGYTTDNIIEFQISLNNDSLLYGVKDWLDTQPDIERYSFANASPVQLTVLNTIEQWRWTGLDENAHTSIFNIGADEQYLNVFQIPLIEGRFFFPEGNNQNKVVINEKLAALMGFEDPVGQLISRGDETYEIAGVVRDFNFQHLSRGIRPFMFIYSDKGRHLFVKPRSGAGSVIGQIREKLSTITGSPMNFSYVEETREQLYSGESQILAAVLFFTILCIVLSGLGLIGMVNHSTTARTKEIAVRKVFGAETRTIMISQIFDIVKMFLPGMIIGGTLAWYVMKKWLEGYANSNGMEGWVFILGPAIILLFALLSISFQTWNSSRQSPAVSLKHL